MINDEAADWAVGFIESLKHSKDPFAGKPFILADWQKNDIVRPLFGTINGNGLRQYRVAYIEIPCKNGKSTLVAALAILLLVADGVQGANVYGAACDRYQAGIVFKEAADMIRQDPDLDEACTIYEATKRIVFHQTNSFYQVLSADGFRAEGINASAVIFDELHTQKSRDLYDVLRKRQSTREQPLFIMITTAGFDRNSICWEVHQYADKIQRGVIENPSYFAYIKSAPEDADWGDEEIWKAVNPGLGDFKTMESMRDDYREALEVPDLQNSFRRYHLNQWTRTETRAIDISQWDACVGIIDIDKLKGARCYGGIDLSSRNDITALVLDFPIDENKHIWLEYFWIPEEGVHMKSNKYRSQFAAWAAQGLIEITPGFRNDYRNIREKVNEFSQMFDIMGIGYDPWNATQIVEELIDDGIEMVEMRQGVVTMSSPTKEVLAAIPAGDLIHTGSPIMRWMADNLITHKNPAGDIKPDKEKSGEKIDGIVAGIMAYGLAMLHPEDDKRSCYEDHGIRSI